MGDETIFTSGRKPALPLCEPLTIIADDAHIAMLGQRLDARWVAEAKPVAIPLSADLPLDEIEPAGIVVVEVDPAVPSSMRRIAAIRRHRPEAGIIAALGSTDLQLVRTLVREGVADVVGIPIQTEELYQAIVALSETRLVGHGLGVETAPLIAVTRALGGAGATTVASHLAHALAQSGDDVCVIDLDLQFGRLAEVLGVTPRRTIADLLEARERVDGAFLRTVAAARGDGVSVIAPPTDILPIEALDPELLWRIVSVAREEFDHVVLEMPTALTNANLSILSRADRIVVVVQQTLESLRHSRRLCDLFTRLGLDPRLVSIVVNRAEKRRFGGITLKDVETALGRGCDLGLPGEGPAMTAAQDQGQLFAEAKPRSAFASAMRRLADDLNADSRSGAGR